MNDINYFVRWFKANAKRFNGNPAKLLTGKTTLAPETWHHIVLVRDGKKVAIYLDGHLVKTVSLRATRSSVRVAWTARFAQSGTHTVRLVLAKLKDQDIAARPKGITAISDDEVLQMMNSMIKQRRDSIEQFTRGGRQELADKEAAEIQLIESYMPKAVGEEEIAATVKAVVADAAPVSWKR